MKQYTFGILCLAFLSSHFTYAMDPPKSTRDHPPDITVEQVKGLLLKDQKPGTSLMTLFPCYQQWMQTHYVKPRWWSEHTLKSRIKTSNELFKHLDDLPPTTHLKWAIAQPPISEKRANAATRLVLTWIQAHTDLPVLEQCNLHPVGTAGKRSQLYYAQEIEVPPAMLLASQTVLSSLPPEYPFASSSSATSNSFQTRGTSKPSEPTVGQVKGLLLKDQDPGTSLLDLLPCYQKWIQTHYAKPRWWSGDTLEYRIEKSNQLIKFLDTHHLNTLLKTAIGQFSNIENNVNAPISLVLEWIQDRTGIPVLTKCKRRSLGPAKKRPRSRAEEAEIASTIPQKPSSSSATMYSKKLHSSPLVPAMLLASKTVLSSLPPDYPFASSSSANTNCFQADATLTTVGQVRQLLLEDHEPGASLVGLLPHYEQWLLEKYGSRRWSNTTLQPRIEKPRQLLEDLNDLSPNTPLNEAINQHPITKMRNNEPVRLVLEWIEAYTGLGVLEQCNLDPLGTAGKRLRSRTSKTEMPSKMAVDHSPCSSASMQLSSSSAATDVDTPPGPPNKRRRLSISSDPGSLSHEDLENSKAPHALFISHDPDEWDGI